MSIYTEEDTLNGCTYQWNNASVLFSKKTHRGTLVEMVHRPGWGVACYMDGTIQSCQLDEKRYHELLVAPILLAEATRICIVGGGEGATAREVFRDPFISRVDMIEWDKDIVELFSGSDFPTWAEGAFQDVRLHVENSDIFEVCTQERSYDGVIVDLFEPEDADPVEWLICLMMLCKWTKRAISIYAGMASPFDCREGTRGTKYQRAIRRVLDLAGFKEIGTQRIYIPSFMGEAIIIWGRK